MLKPKALASWVYTCTVIAVFIAIHTYRPAEFWGGLAALCGGYLFAMAWDIVSRRLKK